MKRLWQGSSVLISLMLLVAIGTVLFFSRDFWLNNEKVSQNDYKNYLAERFAMIPFDRLYKQQECQTQQQENISFSLGKLSYGFHCRKQTIFIKPRPTKEKYILVEDIEDWLNIDAFRHNIQQISSLDDLPPSSEENPKIVQTTQPISGRLTVPFYGIVLTAYPFEFTDKRIFGTIYSSEPSNDSNRRNHSFRRAVIQNIEWDNTQWHYLPSSNNLLQNENP